MCSVSVLYIFFELTEIFARKICFSHVFVIADDIRFNKSCQMLSWGEKLLLCMTNFVINNGITEIVIFLIKLIIISFFKLYLFTASIRKFPFSVCLLS